MWVKESLLKLVCWRSATNELLWIPRHKDINDFTAILNNLNFESDD